jgi:hypothetical protein
LRPGTWLQPDLPVGLQGGGDRLRHSRRLRGVCARRQERSGRRRRGLRHRRHPQRAPLLDAIPGHADLRRPPRALTRTLTSTLTPITRTLTSTLTPITLTLTSTLTPITRTLTSTLTPSPTLAPTPT